MKNLPLVAVSSHDSLQRPNTALSLSLDDSALKTFVDLTTTNALLVDSNLPAAEAARMMRRSHTQCRFVVNSNDDCLGILLLHDLNDQNLLQKQVAGYERSLMTVKDFMRPKAQLRALAYEDMVTTSVRRVIQTMDSEGVSHCLVVDAQHRIRGLIQAHDLIERLNTPTRLHHSPTFNDIYRAVERA